ncbi:MAG TPA: hypothetical protein VKY85_01955 [Candidatus Angelobacter sp.]|nr:hypothetical protein [Candidatus Angelobacter sp.]
MHAHISTDLLKIPSTNGSPINEYRINRGQIEFRSLDSEGKAFAYTAGDWRTLDAGDLQLHFALNTTMAQWLTERLGAPAGHTSKKSPVSLLDST